MFASHVGVTVDIDALGDADGSAGGAVQRRAGRGVAGPQARSGRGRGGLRGGRAGGRMSPHREREPDRQADRARARPGDLFGVGCGAAARVVGNESPDADAARQPRMRAGGIRPAAGRRRSRAARNAHLRSFRRSCRRLHRARRAAAYRDPARAGRQRPGRDGRGVRPRRLRGGGRAHERHHRRAREPAGFPGLRGLRRFLLRRRARRGRGLGQVRSCSTRGRATSSRRSSSAATPSRWACATAAR